MAVSYKEEFTKASVEILNKTWNDLNALERRIADSMEEPGRPVMELTPVLNRLSEAALECEKVLLFYGHENVFPIAVNRAVCRVQRAIGVCLSTLALLRVIPALAAGKNPRKPGAAEPS